MPFMRTVSPEDFIAVVQSGLGLKIGLVFAIFRNLMLEMGFFIVSCVCRFACSR